MAHAFCGSRISPHMSRDNAGNLICHGAVISRSGWVLYRGRELGLDNDDPVRVYRDEGEILSPATIASGEGKTFTEGHPPSFLSPSNTSSYARGHVQNLREGPRLASGDRSLVADIVVTDDATISKILTGHLREISAGYDTVYAEQADGTYAQQKIRINHIALVSSGRGGSHVRIMDEQWSTEKQAIHTLEEFVAALGAEYRRTEDSQEFLMKSSEDERLDRLSVLLEEMTSLLLDGGYTQQAIDREDRELRRRWNASDDPDREFGVNARKFLRGRNTEIPSEPEDKPKQRVKAADAREIAKEWEADMKAARKKMLAKQK